MLKKHKEEHAYISSTIMKEQCIVYSLNWLIRPDLALALVIITEHTADLMLKIGSSSVSVTRMSGSSSLVI